MKHRKTFLVNQGGFCEGSVTQHNRIALSQKRKICDEKSKSFTTVVSELPKFFGYRPLEFGRAFLHECFKKAFDFMSIVFSELNYSQMIPFYYFQC